MVGRHPHRQLESGMTQCLIAPVAIVMQGLSDTQVFTVVPMLLHGTRLWSCC